MKKHALTALALAATTLVSSQAFAQAKEGPWMIRARAVNLASANTDSTGLSLTVNDIVLPEVDVSYFFSPNFALELILTVPQEHDVKASGTKLGTLSHLPPTLLAQYHFPMNGFKPYVGAGINYTRFTTSDISYGGFPVGVDNSSWGGALQAGVDIPLSSNMYLNLDLKKVLIQTNINYRGNSIGTLKVDPVLFGVGLGWRF